MSHASQRGSGQLRYSLSRLSLKIKNGPGRLFLMEKREQNKLCHLFMGDLEMEREWQRGRVTERERERAGKHYHAKVYDRQVNLYSEESVCCFWAEGIVPVLYLSVRRRSSTLQRVPSVHGRVTSRDILICVISKIQKVMKMITILPRHVHAPKRKGWFGMTTYQQMLWMRE